MCVNNFQVFHLLWRRVLKSGTTSLLKISLWVHHGKHHVWLKVEQRTFWILSCQHICKQCVVMVLWTLHLLSNTLYLHWCNLLLTCLRKFMTNESDKEGTKKSQLAHWVHFLYESGLGFEQLVIKKKKKMTQWVGHDCYFQRPSQSICNTWPEWHFLTLGHCQLQKQMHYQSWL